MYTDLLHFGTWETEENDMQVFVHLFTTPEQVLLWQRDRTMRLPV